MQRIVSFAEALEETDDVKRHLLLGNGFSIALFPDRFRYGALLDQADFSESPEVRQAFDLLATTDFEVVIQALQSAIALLPLYVEDATVRPKMAAHAAQLKEILVRAIAGRHPERPSEISEKQYRACRTFLTNFVGDSRLIQGSGRSKDLRGSIYSLNYDLLLYWTLLHDQIVNWNAEDPLNSIVEATEPLEHDDGFRAPDEDYDAAYVTWDAEGMASNTQNIHYLHGALHLFDYGAELQKCCWERAGGIALVDQIRAALNDSKFPLFVSEGSSSQKLQRIRHSGYLQRSLKSFAQTCAGKSACVFIFGHSLAENDHHIFRKIEKGRIPNLYVSFHGDIASDANQHVATRVQQIAAQRDDTNPLEVTFFPSESAAVWG